MPGNRVKNFIHQNFVETRNEHLAGNSGLFKGKRNGTGYSVQSDVDPVKESESRS